MKVQAVLLSAAVGVAASNHQHHHVHARDSPVSTQTQVVTAAGPTVVMYSLNGLIVPESEVAAGIKNGSLVWAKGAPDLTPGHQSAAVQQIEEASATHAPAAPPTTSSYSTTSSSVAPAATSSQAAAPTQSASSISYTSGGSGLDRVFPDGELDCGTFPSDYGAVALDYLGLGGWTGIQCNGVLEAAGWNHFTTKLPGSTCGEGDFCSYACPAGYQKAHWPSTQGATGQSVGGIQCKNGKLYRTNTNFQHLCIIGNDYVNVEVRNDMSSNVAVCRTDYPGTESETVPVDAQPGVTINLTCPDAANYYTWQGKSTSAQYYVNPAGVSVEDGCQWGTKSNPWGNFAPLNIGAGYSNGAAWLSLLPNHPTTDAKLGFDVTIEGGSVQCKWDSSKGQYCTGANYQNCGDSGCTVSASSGTVTFVFSN